MSDTVSESAPAVIDVVLKQAGVAPLQPVVGLDVPGAGWLAVTGADRVRWLNGMVTNSVQALTPGEGAYTFLLSAQGRIQGDATIWAEADRLLLQTSSAQVAPMLALLDRFIIMDDVELTDVSETRHGLAVVGPTAQALLHAVGLLQARASRLLKRQTAEWSGGSVEVLTAYSPVVPRFEVWTADATTMDAMQRALLQAGALLCTPDDLELLRIAEGTPRFGRDIRERELPQETGQTRALHFNKGCYLGQEIVERIRSRGNVHRTMMRFALTGAEAASGTALTAEGKQVGELTSVSHAPVQGERLALGFVRREALERGLPLGFEGGSAEPRPVVAAS